ncbi:MAG: bifunctional 23S rRNA (guanine(2069)-N(7))-methyltransferase RlmK/23S rRNA (guanine(2445)-N(2))-methyltransferase RlmL [Raoultibacter sp.]
MDNDEFFATCPFGFEAQLAQELKNLKAKRVRPLSGGVAFFGTIETAYRACLWSRTASRVLLILSRFSCEDAEALYEGAKGVDWTQHIGQGGTLSVRARGVNDALRNTQFVGVKVKDAVCDVLREARGVRPDVQSIRPDVVIDIAVRGEKATLALDLSGESLHRRGYREAGVQGIAPLKEALAAAILLKTGWSNDVAEDETFLDPMCGSATLCIEAAMIAADMAPGLLRDYWGFTGWLGHDQALWDDIVTAADDALEAGLVDMPRIVGSDCDPEAIALARDNAKRAGLASHIEFSVCDVSEIGRFVRDDSRRFIIATNPPYAHRLDTEAQLPQLYAAFAEGLSAIPATSRLAVITPDESIDDSLGLVPEDTLSLFNGPIETTLRLYTLAPVTHETVVISTLPEGRECEVAVIEKNSDQFAARLRKVAKERMKWARKNNIACYRIYDADLPDYSVSIDLYHGTGYHKGEVFMVIAEYAPPAEIDEERARKRYSDVLLLAPLVVGVDSSHVFSKTRRRDKGGSQYAHARNKSFVTRTTEAGFVFEVDLSGYLDTGIFLDHRMTRALVGSLAHDTRFLNLFAYTGTATVHAAGGWALETTTVDLSQTYLEWAQRNMELNRFTGDAHRFIKADVSTWVTEERRSGRTYDLIFVDPPTFSNSKSMGSVTWSVQRDHAELLIGVSRLLEEGGVAIFSCNLRNFKPDYEKLERYGVAMKDITAATIPHDFERNARIHKCYFMWRLGDTVAAEIVETATAR